MSERATRSSRTTNAESSSSRNANKAERFKSRTEGLSKFLDAVDGYTPTVPVEAVEYYLSRAGASVPDPLTIKMAALAADRFLAKIVEETKEGATLRSKKQMRRKRERDTSDLLETQDMTRSLSMHGINVRRRMAWGKDS